VLSFFLCLVRLVLCRLFNAICQVCFVWSLGNHRWNNCTWIVRLFIALVLCRFFDSIGQVLLLYFFSSFVWSHCLTSFVWSHWSCVVCLIKFFSCVVVFYPTYQVSLVWSHLSFFIVGSHLQCIFLTYDTIPMRSNSKWDQTKKMTNGIKQKTKVQCDLRNDTYQRDKKNRHNIKVESVLNLKNQNVLILCIVLFTYVCQCVES